MACSKWEIATKNNLFTTVVTSVDFKKKWCLETGDPILSAILTITKCPFCHSNLDAKGCTGHDRD